VVRAGQGLERAGDWDGLLRGTCAQTLRLVLVDAQLPGLQPTLLSELARALHHKPEVRVVFGEAAPLRGVSMTRLPALLSRHGVTKLRGDALRELRLLGLGPDTDRLLSEAGGSRLPVLITGERGIGKVRVARRIHTLSGRSGGFVEAAGGKLPVLEGPPGSVFVVGAGALSNGALMELARGCEAAGWALLAGSRRTRALAPAGWGHLDLAPLRTRQTELHTLTLLYLNRYRRRLGVPQRRLDKALWTLIRSHRWPGNAQELEVFVVQVLTTLPGPTLRARDLPPRLRALVEPAADRALMDQADSFEELVERRLRPMVEAVEPDATVQLHKLVIRSTERALLRLVLARTGGNQKAAAALLGLARNTLRTKAIDLGLLTPTVRR
jgi:transcriptional regulator of acetoin/glycerol metabolism